MTPAWTIVLILAVLALIVCIVTWAMKSNLTYAARTDEFTFAWHFKPR